jgi:putative MATE family efflux protein
VSQAPARPAGRAAELALLSPRRASLQLAWPGILENLIRLGAQTVFFAVVGHIGANELAAYGASIQYLFLLFPIWQSLSVGSIALVSRRIGAGEPAEAAAFARQSLLLGLALALVTGAGFLLFAEQLLLAYGATPAVASIGAPYLRLSGGANAITTLLVIALAVLRAGGDTRSPFLITAVSSLVSVPLGYVLLGAIGLPGVAIGWLAANGAALAWALALLLRGHVGFRLGDGSWRLDRGRVATLLDISLPSAGDQIAITLGVWLLGFLALRLGTVTYAAHNVVGQVESISFLPCLGFATAASVMVGQSLGMQDVARAERAGWAAAQTAAIWTSLAGLGMIVFAEPAMRVFSTDELVVAAGIGAMRVIGFGQPAQAINFVMGGALRGAGDTRFTMLVSAFDWFVVRLPLALLFGFVLDLGLTGLWLALVVDYFIRGSIFIWRFRSRAWARRRY